MLASINILERYIMTINIDCNSRLLAGAGGRTLGSVISKFSTFCNIRYTIFT